MWQASNEGGRRAPDNRPAIPPGSGSAGSTGGEPAGSTGGGPAAPPGAGSRANDPRPEDVDDILLDAQDDDWAWRRRIRSHPPSHRLYRWVVALVGLLIVAGGIVAVPAPGPGWLIVFVGLSVLASEFEWAQRLLRWAKGVLSRWNDWVQASAWWVKAGLTLGTALLVAALFWAYLAWQGIPGLVPDLVTLWLDALPGVDPS